MLPIQKDAQRLVTKTSGKFELCVMKLAEEVAEKQQATSVSASHVKVALESLIRDNATLLHNTIICEGRQHAGRRAG